MIVSVKEIKKVLISILIPLAVGFLSSWISQFIAQVPTGAAYGEFIKPSFAPPSFIFPIVWTILYILMGISAYIITKDDRHSQKVNDAMFYYYLQLALNFVWSIFFFGFDLKFTAMITLIILIIVVVIMMIKFSKIDKRAFYLNVPYLLWLCYALFLNYFVWILNK